MPCTHTHTHSGTHTFSCHALRSEIDNHKSSQSPVWRDITLCNKSCSPPFARTWRHDVACQSCIVGNSFDALSTPVIVDILWCCDKKCKTPSSLMSIRSVPARKCRYLLVRFVYLKFTVWRPPFPRMLFDDHQRLGMTLLIEFKKNTQ